MRIFYAIALPRTVKDVLEQLSDHLRQTISMGRWTHRDNVHLTLVFLGEMSTEQAQTAAHVLHAQPFEPFTLTCDGLGCFRKGSRDIWWVGLKDSPALMQYQHALSLDVAAAGLPVETRPYKPHLTLGREIKTPAAFSPEPLSQWVTGLEIPVTSISLMESVRVDGRLVYREIIRHP